MAHKMQQPYCDGYSGVCDTRATCGTRVIIGILSSMCDYWKYSTRKWLLVDNRRYNAWDVWTLKVVQIWESRLVFTLHTHDDVIKWKHFPRYWPFVRLIHRSPVYFPHKGQCNTELWCFLWSAPEQMVEQTIETPAIWDAIVFIMRSL